MTNKDLTLEQKEMIIQTITISTGDGTFTFYGIISYSDFTYSQVTDIIMVNRAYVVDVHKIATDLNEE